jgi:hypothetical protein
MRRKVVKTHSTLTRSTIAATVGARWGGRTITLNNGQKIICNLKGLKAVATRAAINKIQGDVFNLKTLEDLIGVSYGSPSVLNWPRAPVRRS